MTDSKLRELERRFMETGSKDDEAAWLIERTRAGERLDWESYQRLAELNVEAAARYLNWRVETGDLERRRLELAAYCGAEGARVALGGEGRYVVSPKESLWCLFRFSPNAALAAFLHAIRELSAYWAAGAPQAPPYDTVGSVAKWLRTGEEDPSVSLLSLCKATPSRQWFLSPALGLCHLTSTLAADAALCAACLAGTHGEEPESILSAMIGRGERAEILLREQGHPTGLLQRALASVQVFLLEQSRSEEIGGT